MPNLVGKPVLDGMTSLLGLANSIGDAAAIRIDVVAGLQLPHLGSRLTLGFALDPSLQFTGKDFCFAIGIAVDSTLLVPPRLGFCGSEAVVFGIAIQEGGQNGLRLRPQRDMLLKAEMFGFVMFGGVKPNGPRSIDITGTHMEHFGRPHAGQQLELADGGHRRWEEGECQLDL